MALLNGKIMPYLKLNIVPINAIMLNNDYVAQLSNTYLERE